MNTFRWLTTLSSDYGNPVIQTIHTTQLKEVVAASVRAINTSSLCTAVHSEEARTATGITPQLELDDHSFLDDTQFREA
jgi:alkylhydroperoxidase family enzyme